MVASAPSSTSWPLSEVTAATQRSDPPAAVPMASSAASAAGVATWTRSADTGHSSSNRRRVHAGARGRRHPPPHVVERVRALRQAGYRTALVTNNIAEFGDGWRQLIPVDELFEVVVDSCQVGRRKPDPRIFRLALEQLDGVPPEQAVLLDDFEAHVAGARRIGMHGIVVGDDRAAALAQLDALLAS